MKRAVITGIGPVTSMGSGRDEFWKAILSKEINIKPISQSNLDKYKTKYTVPCAEVELERFPELEKIKNKTSLSSMLGVYSALLAIEDAGIVKEEIPENCSVIIGTGFANSHDAISFSKSIIEKERFNRMTIPIAMPNASAAWISILLGTHGNTYSLSTACASGSDAIGHAYRQIVNGDSLMSICGGVDVVKDKLNASLKGFDVLTVLTKSKDGYPRPFSEERSGFLFNEGAACVLIIEELEHAIKRKAQIYAEITGYSVNSDAYNIVMMPNDGVYEKKILEELIKKVKNVDYYNAHGTATILNDQTEIMLIQQLFGDKEKQPVITSTKGLLGHSIGASGALEAAVCALSIRDGKIHGNKMGTPCNNLNVSETVVTKEINSVISASFGFGGHNAALLFQKYK
jgi:3-oxoacyl-(acyl-carrier-protein) synthase